MPSTGRPSSGSAPSNFPGATFNSLGDPDPGRITERDLLAVAMMDTRTEPSMVRALLEQGAAHDTVQNLLDPQRLPTAEAVEELHPAGAGPG